MKVAINVCHGGFSLSDEAVERYAELKGIKLGPRQQERIGGSSWFIDGIEDDDHYFSSYIIGRQDRNDPCLIQTIEEFGDKANGWCAELMIVDIPDDVEWHIDEYDGWEHVAENHRTWP